MREAAGAFVGMHDFASFTDDDPGEKSTRVLDRLEIAEAGELDADPRRGSHFLWKMVRRMVGVLAAVGRGELKPADAAGLLDESTRRQPDAAGPDGARRGPLPRGGALQGDPARTDRPVVHIDEPVRSE